VFPCEGCGRESVDVLFPVGYSVSLVVGASARGAQGVARWTNKDKTLRSEHRPNEWMRCPLVMLGASVSPTTKPIRASRTSIDGEVRVLPIKSRPLPEEPLWIRNESDSWRVSRCGRA